MPFSDRFINYPQKPVTRDTLLRNLRPGSLFRHGHHITPMLVTPEKNAAGQRLAVSLSGNVEWLSPDEPVVAYAADFRHQLTLFGSRVSQMGFQHPPKRKKQREKAA